MDIDTVQSLGVFSFKIVSLLVGLGMCWMGFRLFMTRYEWDASETQLDWKHVGLSLALNIKKTAPGTFFVLFGAIVILTTECTFQVEHTRETGAASLSSPTPLPPLPKH